MRFKLIIALVDDDYTDTVLDAARDTGATGATVVTSARGEGGQKKQTFFGLDLTGQRDLCLFLVAEQLARDILEAIAKAGQFEDTPGAGIAFQVNIEDAIGLASQLATITQEIEDQI